MVEIWPRTQHNIQWEGQMHPTMLWSEVWTALMMNQEISGLQGQACALIVFQQSLLAGS